MTVDTIVSAYFDALRQADGVSARELFEPTGGIDDLVGNHHAGGKAIETLIANARGLDVQFLSPIIWRPPRATIYGRLTIRESAHLLQLPQGGSTEIRWIFTIASGKIGNLCNSRVLFVPRGEEDLGQPHVQLLPIQSDAL